MDVSWKDTASAVIAVLGLGAVFAKLQDYSWWLIGSWKGAVATLGVLGLIMLLINYADLRDWSDWVTWAEAALWALAAVFVVIGLFAASQAMFYSAAVTLAVTWGFTLIRHMWASTHPHHTVPRSAY